MLYAPIALFVYNRPDHCRRVLEALELNSLASESELFIFCDGPKPGASGKTVANINLVREVIHKKKWCRQVTIIERPSNLGLAQSVISGLSDILKDHSRVIVLEDDIVPSPIFLSFMNAALDAFEDKEEVISISSLNFFALSDHIPDIFFCQLIDCWGWATWKRGWDLFEPDGAKLLKDIDRQGGRDKFNVDDAYDYYGMLQKVTINQLESWAIRWYASGFVNKKLSLYPKLSLSKNIGFDGTGVNSGRHVYTDGRNNWPADYPSLTGRRIENNADALREFYEYFHPKEGQLLKKWYRKLGLNS